MDTVLTIYQDVSQISHFLCKIGKKKTQPDKMIAYKNRILILELCLDFRAIVEIIR